MNWVYLALIAPAIYSVTSFIDKYNLEKEVKDYTAIPIYTAIVGFFVGTIFWSLNGFPLLDIKNSLLVICSGMLTVWATVSYFKAIAVEDVSKVTFYFQLQPILILIRSFFILNETITTSQIIGFIIVMIAILGVSVNFNKDIFKISPAIKYVLISDLAWVIGTIMTKAAIKANSFGKILAFESWCIAIGGILLLLILPKIRFAFINSLKVIRKKAIGIIFINELLFVLAKVQVFMQYL